MAWGSAPTLLKVVFVLVLIAVVIDVIGFATAYWQSWEGRDLFGHYNEGNSGLWKSCWSGYSARLGARYGTCGKAAGPSKLNLLTIASKVLQKIIFMVQYCTYFSFITFTVKLP